jgi:type I restriction enzyme R subunit
VQVINQYENEGVRANRYDVTVLVNGLPLVHIELKRRGADFKEAFNQIKRYDRDSFWAGAGLYEYVQIFVISNGTYTKYYSNTTRDQHIKESGAARATNSKKTSNSYEFTSWWADANNKVIYDLVGFAKTFFVKHSLLNILTRYCVFTTDKSLLVMRPYQIVATERILNKIEIATNYKKLGTVEAGGYIWHTTGSGKTLTSFKTAQLASKLPYIDKVLFVVDRKDLDYQTMKEYDKFQQGAANSNTSTRILQQQLEDPNARIIVTTIQKLAKFISRNAEHDIYNGHIAVIFDLVGFAKTFFAKHSLLNILTRYCVFTTDKSLLVMRPYQIVATERILNKIDIATNYKKLGTVEAGGYIWHTTGSGKTLTSFKTAQLASKLPYIDKVLFVVDRKDLDYQTMKEYDKFQQGAANSNTNTRILHRQLEDPNARIIVTTIQKLAKFISRNAEHDIYNGHIAVIFDECHRSQFGDMHTAITHAFRNYYIFGFTGTPIFAVNSGSGGNPRLKTTEQAFGAKLHTYTIVDAINDKNVLPFRIDYINTVKMPDDIEDAQVRAIDMENALLAPERVSQVVGYIRNHFNRKTYRNQNRSHFAHSIITNVGEIAESRHNTALEQKQRRRVNGFNSIFATASIEAAKRYYTEFKRQQADLPEAQRLKIGLIYSFGVNEDLDDLGQDGITDENNENVDGLDKSSRDFLDGAIVDYNAYFVTNYDSSTDKFQNYYKDVSMRVKNRELDLLIVVNMFLTGFDATTLNTLWVDKNLRQHGLLQAFSRTNRILNSVKVFGNIICFRNLEKATNDAIALFGDKEASGIVLLKSFEEYYTGYEENGRHVKGYEELIAELIQKYPLGEPIVGEENQKEFVKLYGAILRVKNILNSFDQFAGREILSERDFQDYQSTYINFYQEWRGKSDTEKENINEDIVFELELIKQVEINIDYILMLIKKYHDGNMQDKQIKVSIRKAIDSSLELRNKKDLIEQFIDSLTVSSEVDEDWRKFMDEKKKAELEKIIADENLNSDETYRFIDRAFRDGGVVQTGTAITKILPPVSRFSADNLHASKKRTVLDKLNSFFNRFFGI